MSPVRRPLEQSSLFDLELGDRSEPADLDSSQVKAEGDSVESQEEAIDPSMAETLQRGEEDTSDGSEPARSSRSAALYAAWVDGAAHLGLGLFVVVGLRLLGVGLNLASLPGVMLLLVVFSLFYFVIPLAFWGRTPGLAVVGLVVRDLDGGPLTLGSSWRRWLAACLTVLLVGLPWLLLLTGRSLADRLSSSATELPPADSSVE